MVGAVEGRFFDLARFGEEEGGRPRQRWAPAANGCRPSRAHAREGDALSCSALWVVDSMISLSIVAAIIRPQQKAMAIFPWLRLPAAR